jgi:signal transduction histidine kinase
MALRPTWRDVFALAIATAAAAGSVALWADGRVAIGLELVQGSNTTGLHHPDTGEESQLPGVFVASVTPDGNAARHGIYPGARVVSLTTVDGTPVNGVSTIDVPGVGEAVLHSEFGEAASIPTEAIPPERIAGVIVGEVYEGGTFEGDTRDVVVYGYGSMERQWLESSLRSNIYAVVLGILVAAVIGLLMWRGWLGRIGEALPVVAGSAAALPLLLVPIVEVGSLSGIYAVYGAVIALSLVLGLGIAGAIEGGPRRHAAVGASVGAAGLAAVLVTRHMLTPELSPDERGPIFMVIAAVTLAPAAIAALAKEVAYRERANFVTVGAVPVLGSMAILPSDVQPAVPPILLAGALLMHGIPWERVQGRVMSSFSRVRSESVPVADGFGSTLRDARDVATVALVGGSLFLALTQDAAWAIVLAGAAGFAVLMGVRQGVLGARWSDAAVPLAASVAVPVLLAPMSFGFSSGHPVIVVPTALASVVVAHLLADRHSDPSIGARLFVLAIGFAALLIFASLFRTEISVPLAGLIPLIPGIPVAFSERSDASAVSWRLETMTVALTPLVATSVLGASGLGVVILGGWLAVIIVWRYFALNPLIGLAVRSQLQRDVAVAAAETERARLAADLHDDALQQLTMLVRTLDEKGQKQEADEAREIATKLRSVVGDLRLPILDDLGAGAALEWLVERVEPLAGGPVKLERSDESRPPANVELAVFRVAQEALTNAIKHGRPPIAVRYDVRTDGRVTLAIDDAGEGIGSEAAEEAPKAGHFGLVNMQQRAEQIGALLDVRRWPAGGTRVALEWRPQ